MAKGDDARARGRIDQQYGRAQNSLDNLLGAYTGLQENAINRYNNAADMGERDYGEIQGKFRDFSETGGYSPEDTANIRSRAISPTRAVYANAQRNVNRQRALQGGYAPGAGVLQARMAREQSQGLSDASTNAEAQIAQMVNEGRRFGTSGMLSAYGAQPGMASMYGNQLNQRTSDMLQLQGLQNQLGLGTMNAQIGAADIKGPFQQAYDNILGGVKTAAGIVKPWGEK